MKKQTRGGHFVPEPDAQRQQPAASRNHARKTKRRGRDTGHARENSGRDICNVMRETERSRDGLCSMAAISIDIQNLAYFAFQLHEAVHTRRFLFSTAPSTLLALMPNMVCGRALGPRSSQPRHTVARGTHAVHKPLVCTLSSLLFNFIQ